MPLLQGAGHGVHVGGLHVVGGKAGVLRGPGLTAPMPLGTSQGCLRSPFLYSPTLFLIRVCAGTNMKCSKDVSRRLPIELFLPQHSPGSLNLLVQSTSLLCSEAGLLPPAGWAVCMAVHLHKQILLLCVI